MVESFWRQSALATAKLPAAAPPAEHGRAGVTVIDRPFRACVNLRGDLNEAFLSAIERTFGFVLPLNAPETVSLRDVTAMWLGPDEWLVVGPDNDGEGGAALVEHLHRSLDDQIYAATDVSENYTTIGVAGVNARETLVKGCPIDLHHRAFQPGHVAQTLLGRVDVILHQLGDTEYDIYVRRSFAEYAWTWLISAGDQFGVVGGRR